MKISRSTVHVPCTCSHDIVHSPNNFIIISACQLGTKINDSYTVAQIIMGYINFAMLNIWYHRLQLLTPVVMGRVCAGEVALDLKQNTWPLDLLIDICKFMYPWPLCLQVHTISLCTQQWGSTLTKSIYYIYIYIVSLYRESADQRSCSTNIIRLLVASIQHTKVDHHLTHTRNYDNNLSICSISESKR